MSKSKAQQFGDHIEQQPLEAVRLAVATVLLAGINAGGEVFRDENDAPCQALRQADWLISQTVGRDLPA